MIIENWIALKFINENKKKVIFSFLAIIFSTMVVFLSLVIKISIEKNIGNDLRTIGKNRILLGGDTFNQEDISFIKSIPDVEYFFYLNQNKMENGYIYKGYPEEFIEKINKPSLRTNDVILDKKQFPEANIGNVIKFSINGEKKEFLIRDFYEEKNPLETMKVGKRVILSQEGFRKNIENREYENLVIGFNNNINPEIYISSILNQLNRNREQKIFLLETPEIYKKVNNIISFLNKTLGILLIISLSIGGFFIFNVTANSIVERRNSIGILKVMGMEKKNILKVFLIENLYLLFTGVTIGIIFSFLFIKIIENILNMIIEVNFLLVILFLFITIVFGMILGIVPIKKIEKMTDIDLLRL